jgi:IMP dehydrogenase/GMP reductase
LIRTFRLKHASRSLTCVPLIAANMDTTGTFAMARELSKFGALTAAHKHYSPEDWAEFAATARAAAAAPAAAAPAAPAADATGHASSLEPPVSARGGRYTDRPSLTPTPRHGTDGAGTAAAGAGGFTFGAAAPARGVGGAPSLSLPVLSSVAVSAGTSASDWARVRAVLDNTPEVGLLCLDVANGYSEAFVDTVRRYREEFDKVGILAGNVVTGEMTEELIISGADIVKVGIGPGSVCTTRKKTGVGYPQLSAVIECADAAHGLGALIISDGGCTNSGDVAKAIGAGADIVMLGGMLAGHDESGGNIVERVCLVPSGALPPQLDKSTAAAAAAAARRRVRGDRAPGDGDDGEEEEVLPSDGDGDDDDEGADGEHRRSRRRGSGDGRRSSVGSAPAAAAPVSAGALTVVKKFKEFYGMSSAVAMQRHHGGVANYRASEGKAILCPYRGPVAGTVQDILGGLRSACTYVGASEVKEMSKRTTFIRVTQQTNDVYGVERD